MWYLPPKILKIKKNQILCMKMSFLCSEVYSPIHFISIQINKLTFLNIQDISLISDCTNPLIGRFPGNFLKM